MGYDYNFEFTFPETMPSGAENMLLGAAGLLVGILLIVYFLALAFSVVSYVLSAVGMYRIAKRRGIHHPWLAWIPVGNQWLLGSISDHYQYVAKHKSTKRRKVMLILNSILVGVSVLFTGAVVIGLISAINTNAIAATGSGSVATIALLVIYYWVLLGLGLAATVFSYIACYDLYQSCKPKNAVLFLVLSVIFNVTQPFFVFACSNSDGGMPERRPQQPAQPVFMEQPADAPAEEETIPVVEAQVVEEPEE